MTFNASTWKKWGLYLVIVLALSVITVPVAAVNATTVITATDVSQYSVTASNDHYIYQIRIDSLSMGTNQTHILNSGGAIFLLEIETAQSYYIYNDFWVTMTYPNGSIDTVHRTITRASDGSYTTMIQPVFTQLEGYTPAWKIDLNIGTNPTTVMFTPNNILEFNANQSIPFTSATGSFSGQTTTVYAYEISKEGFLYDIQHYDPWNSFSNVAGRFFQWTWESVIAFINMIPVVGPQFTSAMVFMYTLVAEILYWLTYMVTNSWLIIGGLEILIAMMAFILAGKKPTPEKVVKQWVNYNVRAVTGFIFIVGTVYDWTRSFIQMVAEVIQGLKPV